MASLVPLLKTTGDTVAEVLDSYKVCYSGISFADYHQIIKDFKALFDSLQKLETESAKGVFRTTPQRAKNNIGEVLNECGQRAKLLQPRINAKTLRDDASTSRDVETWRAEIEFFLRTYGGIREEPNNGLGGPNQEYLDKLGSDPFAPFYSSPD